MTNTADVPADDSVAKQLSLAAATTLFNAGNLNRVIDLGTVIGEALAPLVEDLLAERDDQIVALQARAVAAEAELASIKASLDTPDQDDFLAAAVAEAKYQNTRWADADATKTDSDWFWLVGYLVSKAMHDVRGKRVHHTTAAAAVLANWHAAAVARGESMPEERGDQADHVGRVTTPSDPS